MLGLTSLELYKSIPNRTEQISIFELYTDNYIEFTLLNLKGQLEDIFNNEEITPEHLEDEKLGPLIIKFYKKLKSEKSSTVPYLIL